MSYSLIVVAVLACLLPYCSYRFFQLGYRAGKGEPVEQKKPKKVKLTKEQEKIRHNQEILLRNIDAYDGSSIGQEDFE